MIKPVHQLRLVVKGELGVTWAPRDNDAAPPRPIQIDVLHYTISLRQGKTAFAEVLSLEPNPGMPQSDALEPVLLYDLRNDGFTDIIFPSANRIYHNSGPGVFNADVMSFQISSRLDAAVIADFTGDALPDLLVGGMRGGLEIYPGVPDGAFGNPRVAAELPQHFDWPSVITAGDIDGDGDLDAWLTQYKPPYAFGQMPTPFYDANDGFPAYLLLNKGDGSFVDATESSGLGLKRFRRTYSSSLVDLDNDQDLDLIVVSDFAGIDIYVNDGKGQFTDSTTNVIGTGNNNFGMSHVFADFNGDGTMDFLVVGMSSTTARRLDAMGLGREEFAEFQKMRPVMGYGNRMYLGREGGFDVAPFNDSVARTGWSWGSVAFDFDNDGDRDLYIGNGHTSGKSSKDYCTRFWCHDIYTVGSESNALREALFVDSLRDLNRGEESWNGYEHNALLMNESGQDFSNIGFLLGIAFEYDTRAVASSDLDNDGREDLVVVTRSPRPDMVDHAYVYRNVLQTTNNWIGVQLQEEGPGYSPLGAKITLHTASGTQAKQLVTGDSYRAQHPNRATFGLGASRHVDRLEVKWLNGHMQVIEHPAINQYHFVRP